MQIQLDVNLTVEALFPQVPFLTVEIANGLLLLPSQVRVVGAIADGQDQGRLWNHQVLENIPYFSNYMLVIVHYPGLTSSSTSAHTTNTTSAELPGAEVWPHEQPFSADVPKGGRRFGGGTLALILLSSIVAAVACGVLLLLFLRFNKLIASFRGARKSSWYGMRASGNGAFIARTQFLG
ncbi:hypothetical protein L7F22_067802 [Adiantum nelumboides]|nr:hypothetical protein [Adiantum nelumboides]